MSTPPALLLQGVSKSFGTKKALHHVDLEVSQRESHILLGLSGSGKSTLIRLILGLLLPDEGQLQINGRERREMSAKEWSLELGYVPQDGGLFPHLSAAENVSLVARISGWTEERIQERLNELAQLVSLSPSLLSRFPREISGGQRQRVALMRAAFLNPPLLILDEPLGALDPLIRVEVQNELKEIFRNLGKSVLMVTHDIDEARFFGDRLSLLKDGRILQTGRFDDLRSRPADEFVHRFVSSRRVWSEP